jgi:DNA-binding Lrp family transcriptional regulator
LFAKFAVLADILHELCRILEMALAMKLDRFDHALLKALQENSSLSNAALSDIVHLSPSQISRRRTSLERAGIVEGYTAVLNARALGFGLRAIVRINLASHGGPNDETFAAFVGRLPEVNAAYSVSGDADYVLMVHMADLDAFAELIHRKILPHPQVAQLRSDIVLTTVKESLALPME